LFAIANSGAEHTSLIRKGLPRFDVPSPDFAISDAGLIVLMQNRLIYLQKVWEMH
jgi:hypothetical protein